MIENRIFTLGLFAVLAVGLAGCQGLTGKPVPKRTRMPFEARAAEVSIKQSQTADTSFHSGPHSNNSRLPLIPDSYPDDSVTVLRLAVAAHGNVKFDQQRVMHALLGTRHASEDPWNPDT